MIAQWTATAVGIMHTHRFTNRDLAKEMGVTPRYVGMILNGKKNPKKGEAKVMAALARMTDREARGNDCET